MRKDQCGWFLEGDAGLPEKDQMMNKTKYLYFQSYKNKSI